MSRLKKIAEYKAKSDLEKIIGYLVTRRSGLKLDKHHFEEIIEHFKNNGGHLTGLRSKKDKQIHYEKLHNSIDYVLRKYNLKNKK